MREKLAAIGLGLAMVGVVGGIAVAATIANHRDHRAEPIYRGTQYPTDSLPQQQYPDYRERARQEKLDGLLQREEQRGWPTGRNRP